MYFSKDEISTSEAQETAQEETRSGLQRVPTGTLDVTDVAKASIDRARAAQ